MVGLLVLVPVIWLGAYLGELSARRRRPPAWRARRRVVFVAAATLVMSLTADPALAVGQLVTTTTPELRLPTLGELVSLVRGKPTPDWGDLPQQARGTADGRPHSVGTNETRAKGGNGHKPKPAKGELPEDRPLESKRTEGPSAEVAVGYVEKTSRRVASKSTATSDFYENADGTTTRIMSQAPVNYRDRDGAWQKIDTTLKPNAEGRLAETANGLDTDFAASAADPRLVHLSADGHHIYYGLQGAAEVPPQVEGSTATYPEALAQTDVRLQATPAGLKETLVLKSADAQAEWVFPMNTGDLTPSLDGNGGILFKNPAGEIVTRVPPAYAEDSKVDPRSGLPAMTNKITYELLEQDGTRFLRMRLDAGWLRSPDRVFPVKLDPSYTMYSVSTYVMTGWDGDHSMERMIAVGSWDNGPHTARSYLKFPDQGLDGSGVTVTAAKLRVFNVWASTCSAQQFDVFEGLEPWETWDEKMKKYSTSPGYTQWLGYASQTLTNACNNNGGTNPDPTFGDWIEVPLNASIIDGWAKGTRPDYGLVMASPVNDNAHWKQFASYNNWSNPPQLVVTYTGKLPPRVRNQAPADGAVLDTLTPTLSATGEVDSSVAANIRLRFKVYDDSSTLISDSGNLTTTNNAASWAVPANKLTWGRSYYWTVQTYDGTSYSDALWRSFSVQVPQPAITSSLAQNGGQGFDPGNGNYTTEATDADVETTGPDLAVVRNYNSRDPRVAGAFGAGWSSVFDSRVTERYTTSGSLTGAYVTYPEGSTVGFGLNGDGTFAPPSGRYVNFRSTTGGYTLTDKSGTVYTFTQSLGGGQYGITSIADSNGRAITFTWSSGKITQVKSAVSNRSLYLAWTTPTAPIKPHVSTVTTDPATPGDSGTVQTWSYTYSGDKLTQVCALGCTQYGYTSGSNYHSQVLDNGADAFWPLAEPAGTTTGVSANVATQGGNVATYSNLTLGVPGALAGGSATAADFNGTSSAVRLPNNYKIGTKRPQAISLWFKGTTANGILYSYQLDDPTTSATSPSDYTPALYVDGNGKLAGTLFTNNTADQYTPITSSNTVTDGNWHNVVLTGDGGTQWLYLDGVLVNSKTGLHEVPGQWTNVVGAGYFGYKWPNQPHYSTTVKTGYASFYKGAISNVALFDKTLTQGDVSALYGTAKTATALLTSTTRPSGKPFASVTYDGVSGTVTDVTDSNGGAWQISAPTVQGTNAVYRGAVLGSAPAAYYRLSDTPGASTVTNEVNSGTGTYSNVTLGAAGPLADTAAAFNGTSSYVQLPTNNKVTTGPGSVEMWFSMPKGNTAGGVLFAQQDHTLVGATGADWGYVPALYVGTDGKVHGKFWDTNGVANGLTSSAKVNDGAWHHVALATTANAQTLYLDGVAQGTTSAALQESSTNFVYVGAGMAGGTWPNHPTNTLGYFPGSIAHVAFYRSTLTGEDVDAHMNAGRNSYGAVLLKTVSVRDPGGKYIVHEYDVSRGDREVAVSNPLDALPSGPVPSDKKTTFGYDTGGFLRTVTDPNGNVDTNGHDVRGNDISKTTCQDQAADKCSTSYFSYWPDATTRQLTPDPRNDVILTQRDGRSTGPTDDRYLTVFAYDTAGNQTEIVTPPVPGFSAGRFTKTSYTDGTTIAAADGGYAPKGLPYRTVAPSGATTLISYFKNGDVASVTDPAGLVTSFTYDGLGRELTKKTVSDTYPSGLTETYKYDAIGQMTEETDPPITNRVTGAIHTAKTTTTYDLDGNITGQTVADLTGGDAPRTTSATYNTHGQVESSTDARNKITTFTYDAYGNKASETDPTGQVTTYAYDASGRLVTQKLKDYVGDPNNPSAPSDLTQQSLAYDPAGRLASVSDALGRTTEYTYTDNDLVAKVVKVDENGQNPFVDKETTYDAAGNATKQITNNGATTTESTVDAASRVVSTIVDPTGVNRKTAVSYTPDDLVATSTETDNGQWPITTSYTYDDMGRMTSQSISSDHPDHPVAWWKLNQTSGGTVHDATGDGFTAAAGSAVTWSDSAAVLNGTANAQIATNGPVIDTSQSFSVSTWVKLSSLSGTQTVVSQDGNRQSGFFLKYEGSNGKWAFLRVGQDSDTPSTFPVVYGSTATAGTWAHLAATFNATDGTMTLYVNGASQGTTVDSTPFNAAGQFVIGRGKYAGNPVDWTNGSVSNVQAYNRLLTQADITKLYNKGRTGGTIDSYTAATTKYTLDKRGLPTKITDPNGNATDVVYDEAGNQVVTTLPTVNVETNGGTPTAVRPVTMTGYDTFGAVVEQQDANGNVTTIAYDAEGNQTSVTKPLYTAPGAGTATTATQTWTYDAVGNVTDTTDALNKTTHYTYDQLGNASSVQDANGGVARSVYDANSEMTATTSVTGAQTQATYDHLGRPLTSTTLERYPAAVSATTTYSYAASANNPGGAFLASETSPLGATTNYKYNRVGERTAVTDPAGATTQTVYDQIGRPVKVIAADSTAVSTSYDLNDNPLSVKKLDASGNVLTTTTATYDAAGRQLSTTNARGHTTTFTRDALGQITTQTEPVDATTGIVTSYGYDANGNRTRYTDGRSNSWIYGYNTWNLLESTLEPSTSTYTATADRKTTIGYDAAAQPVSRTLPGGVTVTSSYDDLGRLTGETGSGAEAATASRSFTYDGDGRLTTAATSAIGTTVAATSETFTYNDRDQLLTATGSAGSSSFAYNKDGLATSRTDTSGTTTYGYDSADRLSTVNDAATGTQLTYGYNTLSQVTSIAYGTAKTRTFGYDDRHRLTGDTLKTSGGTTIASVTYGYDDNDNLTSKTTTGVTGASANTYAYDRANRLTSWNDGTNTTVYEYDASGNRIRVGADVYTYDARDQLTSDGHTTYTYTARGTMQAQTGAVSGAFTSDAFGQQITQVATGGGTQTYTVDAFGRILTSASGGTRNFTYSGMDNTVASDGTNTYTRAPDDSLVGVGVQGGTQANAVLALTDQHDDVIGNFTTVSTGLTGSRTYDPLGNIKGNTSMIGGLGFQSGWTDNAAQNKVNMFSRWYNPATGQFQNKDSLDATAIPNSANANPFAYVADNPLAGTDPSGHCFLVCVSKVVNKVTSTVSRIAAPVVQTVSTYSARAWDYTVRTTKTVVKKVKDAKKTVVNKVKHYYHQTVRVVRTVKKKTIQVVKKATKAVAKKVKKAVNKVKKAAKAVKKAAKSAARFVKSHASTIAVMAISVAAFAGCAAVLGAVTAGVGALACGAFAGAVSGLAEQGFKCAEGQSGACSVGSFVKSGVLGAVTGAVGGIVGAGAGGVIAKSALSKVLPRVASSVLGGAVSGAAEGAVTSPIAYGLTCSSSSSGCSWSGAADAARQGAKTGALFGGLGGSLVSKCHSFTASTKVVMADGSSKPISKIKPGDKVKNAVPGKEGKTETHTVARTIVTPDDRDFVDLAITSAKSERGPPRTGRLTTTFHHPFYSFTHSSWVEAKDLKPGDELQQDDGQRAQVEQVRLYHADQITYDLTIDGLHTYYVLAGSTAVLVHNCGETMDFAHGTTTAHAESIAQNGLSSAAAKASSSGGSVAQPGNFFTYRVAGGGDPNLSVAAQWGVTRNGGARDGASVVITRMCRCTYNRLVEEGHITTRVTGEGMPEETIFGPGALPFLDIVTHFPL